MTSGAANNKTLEQKRFSTQGWRSVSRRPIVETDGALKLDYTLVWYPSILELK